MNTYARPASLPRGFVASVFRADTDARRRPFSPSLFRAFPFSFSFFFFFTRQLTPGSLLVRAIRRGTTSRPIISEARLNIAAGFAGGERGAARRQIYDFYKISKVITMKFLRPLFLKAFLCVAPGACVCVC